jgi:CheY-like chemotaxis protein
MSVTEALKQMATQRFDVLITDLHMPEPGDGFTVVTAMRHSQPEVLTLVCSGFPENFAEMAGRHGMPADLRRNHDYRLREGASLERDVLPLGEWIVSQPCDHTILRGMEHNLTAPVRRSWELRQ